VIVNSKRIENTKLKTWIETDLKFKHNEGAQPRRKKKIDKIVIHWTGSERSGLNGAQIVHQSMARRRVGCHFLITNEGLIWQFNDPLLDITSHATRFVNETSIGIEVSCSGSPRPNTLRKVYAGEVHGWSTDFADFYPEQYDSLIWICKRLVENDDLIINPVVLSDPFKKRTPKEIRKFSGILGHAHCTRGSKIDPGPRVMRTLKKSIEIEL
jgi:N-acetyl-anhydromuramyl-L-alanine amidase AmpD